MPILTFPTNMHAEKLEVSVFIQSRFGLLSSLYKYSWNREVAEAETPLSCQQAHLAQVKATTRESSYGSEGNWTELRSLETELNCTQHSVSNYAVEKHFIILRTICALCVLCFGLRAAVYWAIVLLIVPSIFLYYINKNRTSKHFVGKKEHICFVHQLQMSDMCFMFVDLSSMTCDPMSGCQKCHPAWLSLEQVRFCLVADLST